MASKLLIAAGRAASSLEQLPFGVRSLIEAADDILVIAPSLPGRLEWRASDTDKAQKRADERLQAILGQLDESQSSVVRGAVGADDPLLAFEDAIAEFAPGHLLIGLRGGDLRGWQERRLLDQIQHRFGIPMTVFQLPGD